MVESGKSKATTIVKASVERHSLLHLWQLHLGRRCQDCGQEDGFREASHKVSGDSFHGMKAAKK